MTYYAVIEAAGSGLPDVTIHPTREKAFNYAVVRAVDNGGCDEQWIRYYFEQYHYYEVIAWNIAIVWRDRSCTPVT